jgi:hypothetical protein
MSTNVNRNFKKLHFEWSQIKIQGIKGVKTSVSFVSPIYFHLQKKILSLEVLHVRKEVDEMFLMIEQNVEHIF